ncbi:MAG: phage baseplate assembly protein [Methylicorpusculum sp.]|uniref:phage baseplate assembly protein domain-containing protein n=1 Tax=Methylicorpusculum sp. TaxID=2713644 RepID=UPI002725637D|nr:phage baseplate assembly protein [Methylicorpusculum sp.]MDO8941484.1 phage baseplate assembly protein [Methylicorpusculum sp.]MDP2202264.1 phage baseplate assembly protein [Methylicorpusculum sp.]
MSNQIWNRLQLVFAQGVATLVGAGKVQARVLDNEVLDNLNRIEPYGFSYRPKPGAQVYLAFPSGDRSYGVALVVGDKRYQLDLQEGEVAIHDDELNHRITLTRSGIVIEGGGHDVAITDAPTVIVNAGTVQVNGGDVIADGISLKEHVHGNVQSGSGQTGLPQ